jgi:hypothetical protein
MSRRSRTTTSLALSPDGSDLALDITDSLAFAPTAGRSPSPDRTNPRLFFLGSLRSLLARCGKAKAPVVVSARRDSNRFFEYGLRAFGLLFTCGQQPAIQLQDYHGIAGFLVVRRSKVASKTTAFTPGRTSIPRLIKEVSSKLLT